MPGSPKWSLSLRFPHQNPVYAFPLPHMRSMPRPSHSSWFYHPDNVGREVGENVYIFLISNFCHVLNVVCFRLGNSLASEFYMLIFRNARFHLRRPVGVKILHTYLPMKMEPGVPKRRHIKVRRLGITQKKAYNMHIYSQKPKSSWLQGTGHVSPALGPPGCIMWPVATFVNIYIYSVKTTQ